MRLILILLLATLCTRARAQELRTTADGEKIIVYNDGTARYFNDLTLIAAQQRDSAAAAYPVISVNIEPLDGQNDPTEADLRRIAERKAQIAAEAEAGARRRAEASTNNRLALQQDLELARAAGRTAQAATLERRLTLATEVERTALAERTDAEQNAARARRVVLDRRYVEDYNAARRRDRSGPTVPDLPRRERRLEMLLPAPPAFSGYGPTGRRAPVPDLPPCSTAYTGDIAPGDPRSFPETLFTYTDENLRPYLKGREYLRCLAWVSVDPLNPARRFLVLKYTFANPNARTSYGAIDKNSSLSLHLLNGRVLSLQAAEAAVGRIDHGRAELNYEAAYELPRGAINDLRGSALDFVRVFWSSGYEEYEIYRVDVIDRLLECL